MIFSIVLLKRRVWLPWVNTMRGLLLCTLTLPLLGLPVLAAPPSLETPATPIATAQSAGVYLKGRISERFGNSFILEDESGRVLVDTWPEGRSALTATAGDEIGVFGLATG